MKEYTLWLDRRHGSAMLRPEIDKPWIVWSDEDVRKVLGGTWHGCRKGQVKAIRMTANDETHGRKEDES